MAAAFPLEDHSTSMEARKRVAVATARRLRAMEQELDRMERRLRSPQQLMQDEKKGGHGLFRFYLDQNIVAKRVIARERPRLEEMQRRFAPVIEYVRLEEARRTQAGAEATADAMPASADAESVAVRISGGEAGPGEPGAGADAIAPSTDGGEDERPPGSPALSRQGSEFSAGDEIMSIASVRAVTMPTPADLSAGRMGRSASLPVPDAPQTPGSSSAAAAGGPTGPVDLLEPVGEVASQVPSTDGGVHRSRSVHVAGAGGSVSGAGGSVGSRAGGQAAVGAPLAPGSGLGRGPVMARRSSAMPALGTVGAVDSEWEDAVRDGMRRRRQRGLLKGAADKDGGGAAQADGFRKPTYAAVHGRKGSSSRPGAVVAVSLPARGGNVSGNRGGRSALGGGGGRVGGDRAIAAATDGSGAAEEDGGDGSSMVSAFGVPLPVEHLSQATGAEDDADTEDNVVARLVMASFVGNTVGFVLKLAVAFVSFSLAIVGSTIDSFLDIMGGLIIYMSSQEARKIRPHSFPVGRARVEPVAIIVLSVIMSMAALLLVREAVGVLAASANQDPPEASVDPWGLGVLGLNVIYKVVMAWSCAAYADVSPSMSALAQDHVNDSLTTAFALVAVGVTSADDRLWIVDPVFAILLGCYIVYTWFQEGKEQARKLVGETAEPTLLAELQRVAFFHDPRCEQIESVMAYHVGTRIIAEVDLVLDEGTPLHEAHDVGEALQVRLESFAEVERAYVHLDYAADHPHSSIAWGSSAEGPEKSYSGGLALAAAGGKVAVDGSRITGVGAGDVVSAAGGSTGGGGGQGSTAGEGGTATGGHIGLAVAGAVVVGMLRAEHRVKEPEAGRGLLGDDGATEAEEEVRRAAAGGSEGN